jgi:hypothetical protein
MRFAYQVTNYRIQTYADNILINVMFCWPCIIVYQYNETNVMHFTLNLLRIKGLHMFRALLAQPPPEADQVMPETFRGLDSQ